MITPTGRIQFIAVLLLIIGPQLIGNSDILMQIAHMYMQIWKTDQLTLKEK